MVGLFGFFGSCSSSEKYSLRSRTGLADANGGRPGVGRGTGDVGSAEGSSGTVADVIIVASGRGGVLSSSPPAALVVVAGLERQRPQVRWAQ